MTQKIKANTQTMDELQQTGRVFNSTSTCAYVVHSCCYLAKRPNLIVKNWPKHILGYPPLDIALSAKRVLTSSDKNRHLLFPDWVTLNKAPKLAQC